MLGKDGGNADEVSRTSPVCIIGQARVLLAQVSGNQGAGTGVASVWMAILKTQHPLSQP
ncbi:hypothetical protein GGTG_06019 [Gaeumannomyces tritici R3-111a-1]|uniref:Uncharacterized protein n=1 Tax=Gaeumannomyces tritici (strain R3-111a-1) TaxID=644352 RepID=J3NXL3_GAET3|nr:hypothetical protein GGTG_06019 [Gaeumannomyces tritici R3-111a-1]EJT76095.1 hypothetical protein GGTG_06019 [Gaeumannomyces tritici R3-111a-1]